MGILLAWENLLEAPAAALAASSEAPGLGPRSLLTPTIAEVWRSGPWGASTVTLDADLGAVRELGVVAVAAPRDGRLPGGGATVALQASAQAPIDAANLQANPSTIIPGGGTYAKSAAMTDLGAVPGPTGGAGARRLGSTVANGAGVWLGRAGRLAVVGGALYELRLWARSVGAAVTRGTVLTVDEFTVATGGASQRRTYGPGLAGAVDGTWREVRRTLAPLSTTAFIQVFFLEAINLGAEVEIADIAIRRIGDALELPPAPLELAPFGLWAWASAAPVSARHLRLSFTGGATDAYLQLGRAWAGPALITARAAAYGHVRGVADPGEAVRAGISGLRVAQRGAAYRRARFAAPLLSAAEAGQIERAALAVGTTGQVLAARDHRDLAGTGMFGAFAGTAPAPTRIAPALWRAEFDLEEDL